MDANRIVRRQRPRQPKVSDRAVGAPRVVDDHRRSVDRRRLSESLVPEIGFGEILEAHAVLVRVARAPLRARAERVEILVHEHLAERVRRVVGVGQHRLRLETRLRLVELGHDLIVNALLPVSGRVTGRRGRGAAKWAARGRLLERRSGGDPGGRERRGDDTYEHL